MSVEEQVFKWAEWMVNPKMAHIFHPTFTQVDVAEVIISQAATIRELREKLAKHEPVEGVTG